MRVFGGAASCFFIISYAGKDVIGYDKSIWGDKGAGVGLGNQIDFVRYI